MSIFIDRAAALVKERRSQVCLGLDPDPARLPGPGPDLNDPADKASAAERAAGAVTEHCLRIIELAGSACVAVKPQVACFERLGWSGWRSLEQVCEGAREAGLLTIIDGKRGDVPVTARAYGQAMVGSTETPWGRVEGLRADAFTVNPLTGIDSLEPMVAAAEEAGSGVFSLVRTSNPGAADVGDIEGPEGPVHERLAEIVNAFSDRLLSSDGRLSGMGAVVGATEPKHIERLRALMPKSLFLIPGVGAQGGRPEDLGPAFAAGVASALVPASRSIAEAGDPGQAAEDLREAVWSVSL